jgi:hypothetical protein
MGAGKARQVTRPFRLDKLQMFSIMKRNWLGFALADALLCGGNARAAGDLSQALPLWPPADFVYGGSFARGFGPAQRGHRSFSWSSVRPPADGSNRVDNFADAGAPQLAEAQSRRQNGWHGWFQFHLDSGLVIA